MSGPDPGECPICGVGHCACTTASGPITVAQLPQRDAARMASVDPLGASAAAPPAAGVATTTEAAAPPTQALGDGSDDRPFSTATYRGKKKQRR